jgi:DHA1 family tetracycline resistance protein-like MFS transporter
MPSLNSMMSKQLGPERQGELQGGMASVMGLSSILGPWALTETLARFASLGPNATAARPAGAPYFPGAAFVLAALLALISLSILWSQLRRLPPPL